MDMHTHPEVLARVRSKLSWALEHNIRPTLEFEEMKAILDETAPKPHKVDPPKLVPPPAAEVKKPTRSA